MADLITIARPYAKAAFDFAVEKNSIQKWHDMLVFTAQVSQNEYIRSLLTSDMQAHSIAELFIKVSHDVLDEFQANFIKIMAENKRLLLLPEVLALFKQRCLERDGKADVDVISAKPLSNEQLNKITTAVEKRLSRKIKLKCHIDESIISGFIIRTGDMVIDSSIRGRLTRLNNALQS